MKGVAELFELSFLAKIYAKFFINQTFFSSKIGAIMHFCPVSLKVDTLKLQSYSSQA